MMIKNSSWLLVAAMVWVGCADKRPVLYPNAHLKQVGMKPPSAISTPASATPKGGAEDDKGAEVAKSTAGVRPSVVRWGGNGAVLGNWDAGGGRWGQRCGRRPGAWSPQINEPDAVFKNFVVAVCGERHEPIGWR
jgi:hypothetical protein